jgi:predicted nucleic acid-binding protein
MSNKVFVDTNILVYTCDRSEPKKQKQALEVLDRLVSTATGVISTQVLAEFFVAVTSTRKFASPMSKVEAYEYVQDYMSAWEVVSITPMIVLEAVRGVCHYQLSLWDAQLWAAARLNQIPVIYSEDFNVGAVLEGVSFINPFS